MRTPTIRSDRARRGRSVAAAALAAAVLAAGCGEGFDPPSYLDDLRVLAIVTDPIEVVLAPGAAAPVPVTATSYVHVPPDLPIVAESWRYCLLTSGPYSAYECVYPEDCEADLTAAARPAPGVARTQVTLDLAAVGARCLARLADEEGAGSFDPAQLPGGDGEDVVLDTYLRYRVETADGQVREAAQKVPVWLSGAPADDNGPPVIERVEIDGVAVRAGATTAPVSEVGEPEVEVRVVTAADSVDTFVDAYGRTREEDIFVSFYATAGRFDLIREIGLDVTVPWKPEELEDDEDEAVVYVVARDLRGGQDVAGPFRVPIVRAPAP